jgi:hypothetical protein
MHAINYTCVLTFGEAAHAARNVTRLKADLTESVNALSRVEVSVTVGHVFTIVANALAHAVPVVQVEMHDAIDTMKDVVTM